MKHRDGRYMVLGLAGRAGAGKDTCADVLCQAFYFHRMAFADALRKELVDAFGVDLGLFLPGTKEQKTQAMAIGRCGDPDFIALMVRRGENIVAPRSPREIMRWWGTEYRRAQNPVYWLDRAAETINAAMARGFRRIVITDVRFGNEADFVRYYNGTIWTISRACAEAEPVTHQSEGELAHIHSDAVVENNGSMVKFATSVMKAYEAAHAST